MRYTHVSPQDEVKCLAASFFVEDEKLLEYKGRKVLYLVEGTTSLSCCGGSACGIPFIAVPGFVRAWKSRVDLAGALLSEVEPVVDEGERAEIKDILAVRIGISNIDFW